MEITFIGVYTSVKDIWQSIPYGGVEGDYCSVNGVKHVWDKFKRQWISTGEPYTGGETNPPAGSTPPTSDPTIEPLPTIEQTNYSGAKDITYIGSFSSKSNLWDKYPYGGVEGDYCAVAGIKHRWDKVDKNWIDTGETLDLPLSVILSEPVPVDVQIAEAKDLRYLGEFATISEIWQKYPYGGIEGDYVRVDGEKLHWNKYIRQWGVYQEFISQLKESGVVNSDLTINGTLYVENIVLNGGTITFGSLLNEIRKSKEEATEAAKAYADAVALAEAEKAQIYADGIVTVEEQKRLAQIERYLLLSKKYAEDTTAELEIRLLAISDGNITALEQSQIKLIDAQNELTRIKLEALRDGVITEAEQIAIREAEKKVTEARQVLEKQIADIRQLHAEAVEQMADVVGDLEAIKKQVDGKINHYKGDYIPTNTNLPASEWTTDEVRATHIYDIFVDARRRDPDDPNIGRTWQYQQLVGGTYGWDLVEDLALDEMWKRIGELDGSLDGKSTIFLLQPSNYQRGDLWILQEDFGEHKKGTVLISNEDSNTFVAEHWISMLVYITDDELETAIQTLKDSTDRRFLDVIDTMRMLEGSLKSFTESISPISVHTMQMLVGDESIQYRFVDNITTPISQVENPAINIGEDKIVRIPNAIIQHMTLGISSMKSSFEDEEYKFWNISSYQGTSPIIDSNSYYIYIQASRTSKSANWVISEDIIELESHVGYYHLLYGIINKPNTEGKRYFVSLNGFTEILPGQIRLDKIEAIDGKSFWDLITGKFQSKGTFLLGEEGNYRMAYIDGVLYVKGMMVTVGENETTIEQAIIDQEEAVKAEQKAREEANAAINKQIGTIDGNVAQIKKWDLALATDGRHGILFQIDETKRQIEVYCKLFRYGNDVTEMMNKSTVQLYRLERISVLGFDDNGTYDNVWNEANKNKMRILITDDLVAGRADFKIIYDDEILEEEYNKLKTI